MLLYAAGQYANLLERGLSVSMSPAAHADYPVSQLYDGWPESPAYYGSNGADPTVTFDLAAFAPSGAATKTIVVRAGERRRITSTGTTSISVRNLATRKYAQAGGAGWQAGATSILTGAGSADYQVESYTACQAPYVLLEIVISAGTGVVDHPRWNAMAVLGHNLDPGLTCQMRSSTDAFSGSDALEATATILQPGFVVLDLAGISNRYGRLAITGTNAAAPWYGELFPCWLETAIDMPDIGIEIAYQWHQVRNTGLLGTSRVHSLVPWPSRVLRMAFDQRLDAGSIETRQEMVLRSMGGLHPMLVVPVDTEGTVLHGRLSDKWTETRYLSTRTKNDLVLAEDAFSAPLV
jgi:hypothetical protein